MYRCSRLDKALSLLQPQPASTATNTGSGTGTDIDRFAAAIGQQYKDAHDLKEETLITYDTTSGKGVPKEYIS